MAQPTTSTLLTLPVEMLHRIFDELDGTTTFLAVRDVSQLLRAAVDNYHRSALNFTSLSKPDFHRLLPLIRPECVMALALSDWEPTPGQIRVFISLIDIGLFTRLRSLTLLFIDWQDLCTFLKHANRYPLTTLSIISKPSCLHEQDDRRIIAEAAQHLWTLLSQTSLLRLELFVDDAFDLMEKLQWPMQCKLRHLQSASSKRNILLKIIASSPDLETLMFDDFHDVLSHYCQPQNEWFSTPCSRLRSLTMRHVSIPIDQVLSLMPHTPSLCHLKIISSQFKMTNGSRWEDLIKTKLPALNKLEFYTYFHRPLREKETAELMLNEMIAPFCTLFWIEEKRWLVVCSCVSVGGSVQINTSPICTDASNMLSGENVLRIFNFGNDDQHSTVLEATDESHTYPYRIRVGDQVSKPNHSSTLLWRNCLFSRRSFHRMVGVTDTLTLSKVCLSREFSCKTKNVSRYLNQTITMNQLMWFRDEEDFFFSRNPIEAITGAHLKLSRQRSISPK